MKIILSLALILATSTATAEEKKPKECTKESREMWLKAEEVKKKAEFLGYKVKKFKTTESCYEVTGLDEQGKKVNLFFNPVNGALVP